MNTEIWKSIDGYEGHYAVSNFGRVKSLNYNRTGKEKILKSINNNKGYLQVKLWRDGKYKMFYVHRLVATAFIPNPNNYPYINHKDENPLNNCIDNLEWCDAKYNVNYGTRNKRSAAAQRNHPAKSKAVEASRFSDFREICLRFASMHEAGRNGYSSGHVSACCNGRFHREGNNKYKGLFWRFAV